MSNIVKVEDINEELARGYYGDIICIFLKNNNFINISNLCKHGLTKGGKPKDITHWLENSSSEQIIKYIDNKLIGVQNSEPLYSEVHTYKKSKVIDISNYKCIIKRIDFINEYRGYYVHKYLAIQICQWISPEFAFNISRMYDAYAEQLFDKRIRIKNIEINKLIEVTDNLKIKIINNNEMVDEVSKELSNNINKITISITPEKVKDIYLFVIIYKPDGGYYCMRRKQDRINTKIKKIEGKVIYNIQTGNAIALYDSIKNSGIIDYSANNFRLQPTYLQKDLFIFINNKLKEIGEPIENIKKSMEYLKIDLK